MTGITSSSPLPRSEWQRLLDAALRVGAWDFAIRAAEAYLLHHPHDLGVRRRLAQAHLNAGRAEQALSLLEALCLADPEDHTAQRLRLQALLALGHTDAASHAAACLFALGETPPHPPAAWGTPLRQALRALETAPAQAEPPLLQALPADPPTPLPAVAHLHWAYRTAQWPGLYHLARAYHERWPDALAVRLYLAHALNQAGREAEAVALLHGLVGLDPTARIVRRVFGETPPYLSLWPTRLTAPFDLPIPAEVAAVLGRNLLPGPVAPPAPQETTSPRLSSSPPSLEETPSPEAAIPSQPTNHSPSEQNTSPEATTPPVVPSSPPSSSSISPAPPPPAAPQELRTVAQHIGLPELVHTDGRFPVYVLLSTRRGLTRQYGAETTASLLRLAQQVTQTVAARPDWEATLLLADDPKSTLTWGLKPVPPDDAWAIKRLLADLDDRLRRQGQMIGAVCILGGPQVVPFHHLPNPVEDNDEVVPSDNPYGARDENYLLPEWPVGRIPGGADEDPGVLLAYLRNLLAYHQRALQPRAWWQRFWDTLRRLWHGRNGSRGYAAAAWQRAAQAVFRPIGSRKALTTSPPFTVERLPKWPSVRLGYFNLHGMADTAVWYGQRPLLNGSPQEDYPVALRPEDIPRKIRPPLVAFSEACFGAHLDGRPSPAAIPLQMLAHGTLAFVGSTATAYGAPNPPLEAADLLAERFWRRLRQGLPVGEALRQAKLDLARRAHRRQGFLDGDDQKTLLSFVLYGDPLVQEVHLTRLPKAVLRPLRPLEVKAVCEKSDHPDPVPPEVAQRIRKLVAIHLPGMQDAEAFLVTEHAPCTAHTCPAAQLGAKAAPKTPPRRHVVVLHKSVPTASLTHHHYARITLDERGRPVKITLSR